MATVTRVRFDKIDDDGRSVVRVCLPDSPLLYSQYITEFDAMVAWCEQHIEVGAWRQAGTRIKFFYEDDCTAFLIRWS